MSDDIVDRLRKVAEAFDTPHLWGEFLANQRRDWMLDAAEEIERLRAAYDGLRQRTVLTPADIGMVPVGACVDCHRPGVQLWRMPDE